MGKRRKSKYRRLIVVISIFLVVGIVFKVLDYYGSSDSPPRYPTYKYVSLEEIMDLEEHKKYLEFKGNAVFVNPMNDIVNINLK